LTVIWVLGSPDVTSRERNALTGVGVGGGVGDGVGVGVGVGEGDGVGVGIGDGESVGVGEGEGDGEGAGEAAEMGESVGPVAAWAIGANATSATAEPMAPAMGARERNLAEIPGKRIETREGYT
jgi:hypothetical protein